VEAESLLRDTDYTTSRASTGIPSLLGFGMATLAQVVGSGVDHDGPPDNAVRPDELDMAVLNATFGGTLAVGIYIPEVTNVAILILRGTVLLVEGVKVWAGRGTPVGIVSKGVNVESPLSIGIVTGDLPGDVCRRILGRLLERDSPLDVRIATEHGNSFNHDGFFGERTSVFVLVFFILFGDKCGLSFTLDVYLCTLLY